MRACVCVCVCVCVHVFVCVWSDPSNPQMCVKKTNMQEAQIETKIPWGSLRAKSWQNRQKNGQKDGQTFPPLFMDRLKDQGKHPLIEVGGCTTLAISICIRSIEERSFID